MLLTYILSFSPPTSSELSVLDYSSINYLNFSLSILLASFLLSVSSLLFFPLDLDLSFFSDDCPSIALYLGFFLALYINLVI